MEAVSVNFVLSVVALLITFKWIGSTSEASPLPQFLNHGVLLPLSSSTAEPSHFSWPASTSALTTDGEQVGQLTSSWENGQFNLPFSVQAEEISDEEWRQMMTDDLGRHGVLGQVVDTVPPYVVNVDYADNACVHMGNQLGPSQTREQPHQVNLPKNDSAGLYTLMAIDPDVPSQNSSIYSEFLHWLVVNIPDEDIERGDVLAEYLGPLPSQSGGQHRFIFLAHRQPDQSIIDTAALPHAEPCDWAARARFSARKFAQLHRLGQPLAINYFTTQFDSSVPLAIEQCLLRRQSLINIQQRLS